MKRTIGVALFASLALWLLVGPQLQEFHAMAATAMQASPPKPLTSVEHDATLTGAGTQTVPLGIAGGGVGTPQLANGAVTIAKLGTNGSPTTGQVLSFNGSGLTWRTPTGGGGPRVIDANGQLVGPLLTSLTVFNFSMVLLQFNGVAVPIPVDTTGFQPALATTYFTTSDCSGTAYFQAYETTALVQSPFFNFSSSGGKLFYPTGPPFDGHFLSQAREAFCYQGPFDLTAQAIAEVALPVLAPPLHVEF